MSTPNYNTLPEELKEYIDILKHNAIMKDLMEELREKNTPIAIMEDLRERLEEALEIMEDVLDVTQVPMEERVLNSLIDLRYEMEYAEAHLRNREKI